MERLAILLSKCYSPSDICPKAFFITRVEVSLDLSLGVIRPVEVPVWLVTSVLVFHWFVASFRLVILKHCPHRVYLVFIPTISCAKHGVA